MMIIYCAHSQQKSSGQLIYDKMKIMHPIYKNFVLEHFENVQDIIEKINRKLLKNVDTFLEKHNLYPLEYNFGRESSPILNKQIQSIPFTGVFSDGQGFYISQMFNSLNHGWELHWNQDQIEISFWDQGQCCGYYLCSNAKEICVINGSTGAYLYRYYIDQDGEVEF